MKFGSLEGREPSMEWEWTVDDEQASYESEPIMNNNWESNTKNSGWPKHAQAINTRPWTPQSFSIDKMYQPVVWNITTVRS